MGPPRGAPKGPSLVKADLLGKNLRAQARVNFFLGGNHYGAPSGAPWASTTQASRTQASRTWGPMWGPMGGPGAWGPMGGPHGAPRRAQGHGPQGPMGLKDPGLKDLGPPGGPGGRGPGGPGVYVIKVCIVLYRF